MTNMGILNNSTMFVLSTSHILAMLWPFQISTHIHNVNSGLQQGPDASDDINVFAQHISQHLKPQDPSDSATPNRAVGF